MKTPFKIDSQPCADYVADLSAYVDGELGAAAGPDGNQDLARLVRHMGECAGCHDYTNTLRQLSELNRTAATFPGLDPDDGGPFDAEQLDEATADRVDAAGLFASIAGNLVEEKRTTLARLFYEIGKAYTLAGNRALQEKRRQSVAYASRPLPIRGTEARARRELKDAEALERQVDRDGAHGRRAGTGLLLRRSRQLFGSPRRGSATLTRARRFLEEALALDESLDEARLYLGFRHAVIGRPDRARIQFRKVYREARTSLLRLLAAQSLGKLHSDGGDYRRAIECYEEVVDSEDAQNGTAAELFPSFLNLAVNYAKAGDVDRSTETFADLARRFPERLTQIRELLSRKTIFQALLNQDLTLKQTLASRAPALFAA